MATVHQLLTQKGFGVLSIGPDDTVYDAIKKMADENVGSLVVVEHGKLVGLITERHYSRNVFLKGRSSPQTKVAEVMERRRAVWTYRRSSEFRGVRGLVLDPRQG